MRAGPGRCPGHVLDPVRHGEAHELAIGGAKLRVVDTASLTVERDEIRRRAGHQIAPIKRTPSDPPPRRGTPSLPANRARRRLIGDRVGCQDGGWGKPGMAFPWAMRAA